MYATIPLNTIPLNEWLSDPKYQAQRDKYFNVKLDCGHLPATPTGIWESGMPMTTGYGTDPSTGEKLCYDCCAARDAEYMKRTGRGFCYLKRDSITGPRFLVTTWPGNVVSGHVSVLRKWRNNFGDTRVAVRFSFNGEVWSGVGPGEGMYLRVRRTKLPNLYA